MTPVPIPCPGCPGTLQCEEDRFECPRCGRGFDPAEVAEDA